MNEERGGATVDSLPSTYWQDAVATQAVALRDQSDQIESLRAQLAQANAQIEFWKKQLAAADDAGSMFMEDAYRFHDERDQLRAENGVLVQERGQARAQCERMREALLEIAEPTNPEWYSVRIAERVLAALDQQQAQA